MSTDLYKQVFYNDGEGITYGDLNDAQRYAMSRVWDQIIHNQIGVTAISGALTANQWDPQYSGQDGSDHSTSRAYCLNPGAAYLRKTATSMQVGIAPGTLLQKIGVLTGDDPQVLSYTFTGAEFWTVAAADATNPRCDLLQMKLEWITNGTQSRDFEDATTRIVTTTTPAKKRVVQCTLSVKQGLAAVSPVIPEPDAGYVPVGSYCIGATAAAVFPIFGVDTAGAVLVVHDQRMPLNVKAYVADPSTFRNGTAWAVIAGGGDSWFANNATNDIYIPCPVRGPGRIVAIGLTHQDNATALTGVSLGENQWSLPGGYTSRNTITPLKNVNALLAEEFMNYVWEGTPTFAAGPVIQQSVTTKIGLPVWCNGRRAPIEQNYRATATADYALFRACVRVHNTAAPAGLSVYLGPVTFYVAEGL